MSLSRSMVLLPALLLGVIASADAQPKLMNAREKIASAVVKKQLEKLRAEIKTKKRKYTVAYTTAMDLKLVDLARTVPPPDLPKVATEQNAKASAVMMKFNAFMPKAKKLCDPNAAAFDWKTKSKTTPVRNQGQCGSCWSFTGSAAFEGSYLIVNNKSIDVSEQQVVDCAKTKTGKDAGSCSGGWYGGVFDHFVASGAVAESSDPYKANEQACDAGMQGQFHAATWGYVKQDGSTPSTSEMKEALCAHGPLATTVFVTDAFMAYDGGVFEEDAPVKSPKDVNHGITLVGWDDNKGAYLIKNSWGPGWGEDGFIWIAYGAAWVMAKPE